MLTARASIYYNLGGDQKIPYRFNNGDYYV